jgi:hypothetical protein
MIGGKTPRGEIPYYLCMRPEVAGKKAILPKIGDSLKPDR